MGVLVAVVAHGGPAFVAALRQVWDEGDAVLPVDPRLPDPARRRLLAMLRPAALVTPAGAGREIETLDHGRGEIGAEDALVVPTSGTTGEPKGVVLTHDALAAHARMVHAHLGVTRADRWLACLPLAHVGGLGVVVRALIDGIGLEVHPGFDAEAVIVARDGGATLTSLVPTALDRVGAEGFRWVVLGGSADTVAERPANVVRTWGLTETGGGVVYDGRPLPGVEVRAIDGELWVRSPTLARGVRRADTTVGDLRRARPEDPTSTGWLATGDGGDVAANGTVTVRGRRDDMIVTGGENVWPDTVEAVLRLHPALAEVAVAGRPDTEWGQRVVAWVVPRDGVPRPSLDEVRGRVRDALPAWCAPRELRVVAALPRTPLGKVRRGALRTGETPDGPG
ncbi:class I adenylate-forming enzyme family protein [Iamia sp.]|uniref:class I adenylate-forming enzyme family protein n=1 Tax=Iamia sp. TaxID=2722710 RepID=UPI002B897FE2|nr:AMP-binding protein [Iamia sp.]HXH58018.1 AMP-binding protein [Iamia sp.]